MDRNRWIGLALLAIVLAFLAGFLPQWSRANRLQDELVVAEHDLVMSRLEGQLGAALAESLRSNYERSRQLMTDFFAGLDRQMDREAIANPRQRRELQAVLAQRDEIVTLLARAEPESTQRLMLLYTRYFTATDPAARRAPTAVTPSPPAP